MASVGEPKPPTGGRSVVCAVAKEVAKEDGLFDTNFNKVLKKNSNLFKGAITADKINEDEDVELTGEGQIRLAEVIRKLAGE